jgi:hypothetical protein
MVNHDINGEVSETVIHILHEMQKAENKLKKKQKNNEKQ